MRDSEPATTIQLRPDDRAFCVVLSGDEVFDAQLFKVAAMTVLSGGNRLIVIGERQPGMDQKLLGGLDVEFYPTGTMPPVPEGDNCVLLDGPARARRKH